MIVQLCLPWKISDVNAQGEYEITSKTGVIAANYEYDIIAPIASDAKFITHACNNYYQLIEALEKIASGEIAGEKGNYKDMVYIIKQIANEALKESKHFSNV